MGELYKLKFTSGESYIGKAVNGAQGRLFVHRADARNSDRLVYRAWRKYGEPVLTVLAVIEDELLCETEIKAIAVFKTLAPGGYNLTLGGEGAPGRVLSLETRAKLSIATRKAMTPERCARQSAANLGRTHTPETRVKLSAASKGNQNRLGLKHTVEARAKIGAKSAGRSASQETRAKMSKSQRGHPVSLEQRAKLSAAHAGKILSKEHKAKLSEAKRGFTHSLEARAKISAAGSGRRHTPEARAKMSKAHIGKRASPEARAKMSAARKAFCASSNLFISDNHKEISTWPCTNLPER